MMVKQAGTSHYFGDGFAKAFDIKFQGRDGKEASPYQTSWGMSTRSIGGIIMTHGDERGLKLPPKIAPIQVVIVPFAQHKEGVVDKAKELEKLLKEDFRVELDIREEQSPGFKCNHWELRGVPVRLEIGPKDIEKNECVLFRRDTFEKKSVKLENVKEEIKNLLEEVQDNMLKMAIDNREKHTYTAKTMKEIEDIFSEKQGFVKIMWCGSRECEDKIKESTTATIRCIPENQEHISDNCPVCGNKAKNMVYIARQY